MINRAQRRKCKNTFEMATRIENNVDAKYRNFYEKKYQEDLGKSIDHFIVAIVYTLHFNESTRFGRKRIKDFMSDLFVTIDLFRKGEYTPDEYRQILLKDDIEIIEKGVIKDD